MVPDDYETDLEGEWANLSMEIFRKAIIFLIELFRFVC